MSHIYFQSEEALYSYMKKFLKQKPKAVQLDGSTTKDGNKRVVAVFQYSVNQKNYKVLGGLTREAAESFVRLTEEQGSSALALKEFQKGAGLILADSHEPGGWLCEVYSEKASEKL